MFNLRPLLKFIFLIGISAWLTACGGSSSSNSDASVETSCVIGAAKIGECKI